MKKVIELITKAGGKRDVRVNWDKLADELLRHFKTLQTREVSGRKRFLTHEEYKDEVGHYFDGEDIPRGQRHWQGKYKGVDGIWIQEKMGIEVQHEAIEGLTHSNAYDNAGMDLEENEKMDVFEKYGLDMLKRTPGKADRSRKSELEGAEDSTTTPSKSFRGSSSHEELSRKEDTPTKGSPASKTEPSDCLLATPKKGGGAAPAQKAGGAVQAKPKAKAKGRPPKSIVAEASELCSSFAGSEPVHQLWWTGENKTQIKKVKDLKGAFSSRIGKATGPDAVDLVETSEPWHQRIAGIHLLMEAHQKCGFDNAGFMEVYDCVITSLRTYRVCVYAYIDIYIYIFIYIYIYI